MNQPATKEPSMDEILSSIRQIIADDDKTAGTGKPILPPGLSASLASTTSMSRTPEPTPFPSAPEPEPLALSPQQMLTSAAEPDIDVEPELQSLLVEPEDIAFDGDMNAEFEDADMEPEPVPVFSRPPRMETPRPVAETAPLPDPRLTTDLAEKLIGPATDAAARMAFNRLGSLSLGNGGATVEGMIREMLRPMLKEWLDEHLPAVVERMVEKEITRISRGGL